MLTLHVRGAGARGRRARPGRARPHRHLEALEAERTIEARGRIENLEELVGVAQEFRAGREEPTLSTFLQEISLVSDQDGIAAGEAQVTLMTIHNAKGLEYRGVFLIGMEEGIFPHARSIEDNEVEEERRLATSA